MRSYVHSIPATVGAARYLVTQLRVRLGLDDEPVTGRAHYGETGDDQRLWLADFVVRHGAGFHVSHHFCFRRTLSAQRAEAGVC
jgi:hypothetical protein